MELGLDSRVVHLLNTVHNVAQREEERQMATVLLRRLFTQDFADFYPAVRSGPTHCHKYFSATVYLYSFGFSYFQLAPEAQQELKTRVLSLLHIEQSDNLRRKSCEVVAELARNLIDDDGNNTWPEFLQFLFQCANSPSPILKEASLRMFAYV